MRGEGPVRLNRLALVGGLAGAIFATDWVTPLGYGEWLLYVVLLPLSARSGRRRDVLATTVLCTVLLFVGFFVSPPGIDPAVALISRAIGALVLWLTALLVSRREEAEAGLRDSEEKFFKAFDANPAMVALSTLDGRLADVNQAYLNFVGRPREEVLGKTAADLGVISEEERARIRELIERGGASVRDAEITLRVRDGSLRHLLLTADLLSLAGAPHRLATLLDITDRKQAEAALSESQHRLALATGAAQIGIWDWDVVEDRLVWDTRMCELYGVRPQDFGGAYDAWHNGVHPEDRARTAAETRAALDGARDYHTEFRVVWPNGKVRHIEAHGVVLRDAHGSARRMIGVNWDITERVQAESARGEIERSLTEAQRIAQVGSWRWDLTGPVEWSAELYRVYGLSPETFTPTLESFFDLVHPEDRPGMREWLRACRAGESPAGFEFHAIRPDGTARHISGRGALVCDPQGRPVQMVGTAQDITERRQREAAQRESEERFAGAFHASPAAITITRVADGRFVDVNQAFLDLFEFSRDEVIGRTSTELNILSAEERGPLIRAQLGAGGLRHAELQARVKSGRVVSLLFSSRPMELAGETHHVTTLIDISARKQAEAALRESEARLRLSVGAANVGLWDWELGTSQVFFSPEWKGQIGYGDDEISNDFSEWQKRVHPDDLEGALRRVNAFLANPEGRYEAEFRFRHKNGTYRWIYTQADVLRDGGGKPARMLGCHIDITERRQKEDEVRSLSGRLLKVQDEERRRLARELHDQTAQLLAAIAMNLSSLRRLAPNLSARASSVFEDTQALTEQASREIRTFSYLLHPPALEDLGLVAAVREYADGLVKRGAVEVTVEADPAFPRLPDEVELALFRTVQEALSNILRHSGSATADIRFGARAEEIRLEVRDAGRGRTGIHGLHTASGMGVGVTGMRERLRQLGGQLEIDFSPRGTTVTATLPGAKG